MSVLNPFNPPLHYEFFCLTFGLAVVFELYTKFRQLKAILYQPARLESHPNDDDGTKEAKRLVNLQLGDPNYDKALQYQRDKLIFASARLVTVFALVTAWLLFLGGPKLWDLTEKVAGKKSIYHKSSLFVGLYLVADRLMELPFKLWDDLVLEQVHGFNKKTLLRFFKGFVTNFFVLFQIWLAIVFVLQFLHTRFRDSFLLYAFVSFELALFAAYFVYPLHGPTQSLRFSPLDSGELKSSVDKLAQSVGVSSKCIFKDETSKVTSHSNAYVYGIAFTRRIAFYDTILKAAKEQVVAIFAHELGHYKHHHPLIDFFLRSIHVLVVFGIANFLKGDSRLYESFGYRGNDTVVVGLLLTLYIFYPFKSLVNVLYRCFRRSMERQADDYAVKLGYGEQLAQALVTCFKDNKKSFYYDPFYAFVNETHPTVYQRLLCYLRDIKAHNVQ